MLPAILISCLTPVMPLAELASTLSKQGYTLETVVNPAVGLAMDEKDDLVIFYVWDENVACVIGKSGK